MLLIDDILTSPVHGIFWIFREINKIAQKELDGESESISEQLRNLYMQLETDRITEPEFDAERYEEFCLDTQRFHDGCSGHAITPWLGLWRRSPDAKLFAQAMICA